MPESLTDESRKIMAVANQEATRRNRDLLGPEHILLATLKVGFAELNTTLGKFGVEPAEFLRAVERAAPVGGELGSMGKLPRSPAAKTVVEGAIEEAAHLNPNVGPEHLLLSLLRDKDGLAASTLTKRKVDLEQFREEVSDVVQRRFLTARLPPPDNELSPSVRNEYIRETRSRLVTLLGEVHALAALLDRITPAPTPLR